MVRFAKERRRLGKERFLSVEEGLGGGEEERRWEKT